MKGPLSQLARLVAGFVTRGLFRGFEMTGVASHDGPRLIVANHFNGFVDAVVLVRALGGLPHFIAKSTLFERLPMRLLLGFLGVIPVYRRVDQADVSENRSSFNEVHAALAKGQTVLIFPEGTVTDSQQLQTIRTGAARITLGAMADGVRNIVVVPMGVTYEDKVATRSRVLVEVGAPINADEDLTALAEGDEVDPANHALVRATTDLIRQRLTVVSPDYGSFLRERVMMSAAEIHVRTNDDQAFSLPPLSEIRAVSQRLANLPDDRSDQVLDGVGRYDLALSATGLRDDQINPTPQLPDLARVVARKGVIVLLLLPFALVGLLANLVPTLVVYLVGAAIREPVTKGTARVLTALVVFPLAWIIQLLLVHPDYMWLALVMMVLGAVLLLVLFRQALELIEAAITYSSVRSRRYLLDDLGHLRQQADADMTRALAAGDAT